MTRDEVKAMIASLAPLVEQVMLEGERASPRARVEQTERDLVQARIASALERIADKLAPDTATPNVGGVWGPGNAAGPKG